MRGGFVAVAAVIAATASVAVAPSSASAAQAQGSLVISGSSSAAGWITLPRKARLSPSDLDPFEPSTQVHTSGHVGGVLVWSGKELVFAEIKDDALSQPLLFGGFSTPRAGARYAVQLIADGPTRVALSLTGTREHLAMHPSRRLTLKRSASRFPVPDSPIAYESVPVDVRSGSMVIVAGGGNATDPPAGAGLSNLCIESINLPCQSRGVDGETESASVCIGGVSCQTGEFDAIVSQGMSAGRYFAVRDSEDTGLQHGVGMTALTLTPTRQRHGG